MKKKKLIRIIIIVVLLIAAVIVAFRTYTGNYYHAKAYETETSPVEESDDYIAYGDEKSSTGLIFYPGAKVEETAYAPLMDALAGDGLFCVVVKMPERLAVLDPNAAAEIMEKYDGVEQWYLAGHSLGGAMAANFAAEHESELSGLILLAAYPTKELKELPVLSIYGSEDEVLNKEKYEKSIVLADVCTEYVIEGGNHAGFGNYGEQKGDGEAAVSGEEQWQETADYILNYIRDSRARRE